MRHSAEPCNPDGNEAGLSPLKKWAVGFRPFAYSASATGVLLGAALARSDGFPIRLDLLALTLLGVVSLHTGANLLNDYHDFRRGLDREVLPGSGALVRGWLTQRQVFRAGAGLLAAGALCCLALAWLTGWPLLALGAAGVFCAAAYTTGGICLKYMGVGDLAVFLSFGVLNVAGAYFVQARRFDSPALLWSLPLSMLAVGILHANNWRDLEGDSGRGCRTLAARLGPDGSRRYYRALVLGPFALSALFLILGQMIGGLPAGPALAAVFLALPAAVRLARIGPRDSPDSFAALDARTARLHLLFGLIASAALAFG